MDAWADLVYGSACVGCGVPGRLWCRSCAVMLTRGIEPQQLALDVPGVLGASMGEYEAWLREMILAHKEHSAWSLAAPLGELLAQAIRSVAARGEWLRDDVSLVLVPIPSRPSTIRARGHNPSLRMTRRAAHQLRLQGISAHALPMLRLRLPVKDSVGLGGAARRRNLEDAFAVQPAARRALSRMGPRARLVVCDDVMTTGATIREACAALALAGLPASGAVTVTAVMSK